ncbi:uncharacterized protein LOC109015293 [Juglans regia]|uniref:Uncharacterized protein LOC109015293 n=1 Tax=Juglans regia TaxID=51240 RepID=A0A6P9EQ58_JUGRE|nr:uncharacterized protein LOC109015293 [Juglans regia]
MYSTGSSELPQKSQLQIEEDDKFFSRLLSKESSAANPSLRVPYYGGVSGAVPFMWESRPGTPKHTFSHTTLVPPLTPPPSYYSNSSKKPIKNRSRSNLLHALFPKISLKKGTTTVSPSPSSGSISSTWSSPSDSSLSAPITYAKFHGMKRVLSQSSSFDSREDDEHQEGAPGSPTSTLCFGIGRVLRFEAASYRM